MLLFLLDNSGTLLRNTKMYKDEWNVPLTLVLRRLAPKQVPQYVYNVDHIDTDVFSHCRKKNKSHRRAASKHCRRSPRRGHGHYAASFAAIASDATVRDCSCQQECQLIWTFLPDVLLSCPMYYNNRCSRAQSWLSGSYAGMVPSYHVNSTWLQTRGPKRALPFVLVLLRYDHIMSIQLHIHNFDTHTALYWSSHC